MSNLKVSQHKVGDVNFLLYRKESKRKQPLIIVLHGSGNDLYEGANIALNLAFQDFCVVCFDAEGHGERLNPNGDSNEMGSEFFKTMVRTIEQSSKDISSLIGFCEADSLIDTQKVGLLGISLGALSVFYSLADQAPVQTAVSIIGSPDFEGLARHAVCAGRDSPDDLSDDDRDGIQLMEEVNPLAYLREHEHRSMLLMNGKNDDWIPAEFSKSLFEELEERYKQVNTDLEFYLSDGSHYVSNEMRDYAVKWLRKQFF